MKQLRGPRSLGWMNRSKGELRLPATRSYAAAFKGPAGSEPLGVPDRKRPACPPRSRWKEAPSAGVGADGASGAMSKEAETASELRRALHKPLIIQEGASILRTLDLFRKTPIHSAVIVDEYGSIQGIVTRTDLLEVLAGDLPNISPESEPKVIRRNDGAFLIDGTIPILEVADILGLDGLRHGDYLTLAGFMLSQLQHVAQADAHFAWGQWRFQIAEMDGHRIEKVLVRPTQDSQEEVV